MFYAACMAARAQSADPRAERVRARLRDAAFALAHERPVDQLTVGEIVSRAGVSRQVFYQHFADRDDAVATAFTVAFAVAVTAIDGDPSAHYSPLRFRGRAPRDVPQRRAECGDATRSAFRAELAPACEAIAARGMPVVSGIAGLTPDSVTRFLVGGFVEVLRSWMEDPDPADLRGRVTRRSTP